MIQLVALIVLGQNQIQNNTGDITTYETGAWAYNKLPTQVSRAWQERRKETENLILHLKSEPKSVLVREITKVFTSLKKKPTQLSFYRAASLNAAFRGDWRSSRVDPTLILGDYAHSIAGPYDLEYIRMAYIAGCLNGNLIGVPRAFASQLLKKFPGDYHMEEAFIYAAGANKLRDIDYTIAFQLIDKHAADGEDSYETIKQRAVVSEAAYIIFKSRKYLQDSVKYLRVVRDRDPNPENRRIAGSMLKAYEPKLSGSGH